MEELQLNGKGGQLVVDSNKVVIKRKGVLSTVIHGIKGDKTIPISSISAIQFKEPNMLINGYIQFSILGGNESIGGVISACNDENSVVFTKDHLEEALTIKEFVENIIYRRTNLNQQQIQTTNKRKCKNCGMLISEDSDFCSSCGAKQVKINQQFSSADEILKFKCLWEQGIITKEEFDKKKNELLGI